MMAGGSKIGVVMPWTGNGRFCTTLAEHVPFDVACVGILDEHRPQVDELFAMKGLSSQGLSQWLGSGFRRSSLYSQAKRYGWSTTDIADPGGDHFLSANCHVAMAAHSAAWNNQRWWSLILARQSQAFTSLERQKMLLMLRIWQVGYDQIDEPGMGRLLIGHDDRLLHADPQSEMLFLQNPGMLEQLLSLLHVIVPERWPMLRDGQMHDFVVRVAGRTCWVRFARDRAINAKGSEHWNLEIRTALDERMPPIGSVPDKRIAHALAYLHDFYDRSPNLAQIATFVDASPFHFHRLFSKTIGISPKRYLQLKQLQVAKWLLRTTHEPIGEIAGRTGFRGHGHFINAFHRSVGVRPSEYREQGWAGC